MLRTDTEHHHIKTISVVKDSDGSIGMMRDLGFFCRRDSENNGCQVVESNPERKPFLEGLGFQVGLKITISTKQKGLKHTVNGASSKLCPGLPHQMSCGGHGSGGTLAIFQWKDHWIINLLC